MAGRAELVRRSLAVQDSSLRVLSQLLSRFLYPTTQREQQSANVLSDVLGGPLNQVRPFHGVSGRFQQAIAYEERDTFEDSATRGEPSDGGGKGPNVQWRNSRSHFMPRSLEEDQARYRSAEFQKERQFVAPPDDRRGKVHWVEIDEDGKYKARDPFGTELDPRLNEFLEASKEQLEAFRIKASHRRGVPVSRAPVDKTWLRWPEQFQVSAVLGSESRADDADGRETRAGTSDDAKRNPESIASSLGYPKTRRGALF